jgi:2-polyprenyl-6-methoxyphenol hydroxylase-like FAD-dependent oxidoreductase
MRKDVCVVGGGPAGAAAAIAAANLGASVTLIAGAPASAAGTVELLSSRAGDALAALGVYALVSQDAVPCSGTISRWDGDQFLERSSLLQPRGVGWMINRTRLDARLVTWASTRGVTVVPASATAIDLPTCRGDPARVRWPGGMVVANLVIVAVGRGAGLVRRQTHRHLRHRLLALSVRLPAGAVPGLGHRLLVDRAPDGWWYALDNGEATTLGFCTDAELLGTGRRRMTSAWERACQAAWDWLPAEVGRLTPHARPAATGAITPVSNGPVQLVGDTALAVDPLSGHGLTLALESASRWAEPSYAEWIADTLASHERQERAVYGSVETVDGPFWASRRGAARRSVPARGGIGRQAG